MNIYLRPRGITYNEFWWECPICGWRGNDPEVVGLYRTAIRCKNSSSPVHRKTLKPGELGLLNIVDRLEYEPATG